LCVCVCVNVVFPSAFLDQWSGIVNQS